MRRQKRKIGFSFHVQCSECVFLLHLIKCSLLGFPMCSLHSHSMTTLILFSCAILGTHYHGAQKKKDDREYIKLVCGGYSWFMYCSKNRFCETLLTQLFFISSIWIGFIILLFFFLMNMFPFRYVTFRFLLKFLEKRRKRFSQHSLFRCGNEMKSVSVSHLPCCLIFAIKIFGL